jgi:hypothetical protein
MRKLVTQRVVGSLTSLGALLAVVALSSAVTAEARQRQGQNLAPGYVAPGVPAMPDPPGPAPQHDLNGSWMGPAPQNLVLGPFPAMTPAGEAKFKFNKPVTHVGDSENHVEATNDPYIICDPLGFPRDLRNPTLNGRGEIHFAMLQNRMLVLFALQRVWRDVWMDGRQLPEKVDAPGASDSRFYGYSVGHWEGDNVFVIDTTGLDPRTWLDEVGHPHTTAAKIQERYTRVDQYNLEVTATVDDPKFYTKPFQLIKAHYYWMKNQDLDEILCIPSEAIDYQNKLANPSGWGPGGAPAK